LSRKDRRSLRQFLVASLPVLPYPQSASVADCGDPAPPSSSCVPDATSGPTGQ
jgi:hypothetical protein